MKKVLLIGAKGQVGQELQVTLPFLGEVISIGREELDLTNSEKISQLIREIHPDYLVNAAAYTAVDKAESEPDLAYSINATAPKIMAESAEKIKAKFLHQQFLPKIQLMKRCLSKSRNTRTCLNLHCNLV